PTEEGRAAVARIGPGHAALADRLAKALGEDELAATVRMLERLSAALDEVTDHPRDHPTAHPVTEP
ncbi:MarR family transcriptional regulator, partial [Streptomyces sp. NPDC000188]